MHRQAIYHRVVICLKIRTFVVSATTSPYSGVLRYSCDLLENSYLCGISNNQEVDHFHPFGVVICLKIRTFVVSATTRIYQSNGIGGCDLLENSYLCGISNNLSWIISWLADSYKIVAQKNN